MDHFCYLCIVFAMLSCLFIAAMWSPAGKVARLYVKFSCVSVTFPYGVLGQVWHLVVMVSDLCLLTYFIHYNFLKLNKSSHKIRYIDSLAVKAIPYNRNFFSLFL